MLHARVLPGEDGQEHGAALLLSPLPSQKLPRIPAHCLLPVPWLLQLLHVQALRFLIALYFTILLIALNTSHAFASLMSGSEFVANNTTYYTARINTYIKPVL